MALTGLRADWEIGKFLIGPSSVAAAKKMLTGVPKESVAPSIYSGGGGPTKPSGPNPAVQSAREQIAGKPAVSLATGGAWDMTGSNPTSTPNIQTPTGNPTPSPSPLISVKDGWSSTPNPNVYGGRVLSMGRPGDPNSGTGYVSGPARSPRQQMGLQSPGYSFQGSAADASKFFAPVSRPAPTAATLGMQGGDYRQIRAESDAAKAALQDNRPKYIGPESGIPWRTREKMYEADMDAYNKDKANKSMMGIEAMREAGAGQRSMLQARGVNDRNALDAARLRGDQGMQALEMQGKRAELGQNKVISDARAKLAGLEPGTPEFARQERLLAGLSGKYGEQKQQNIQMLEEPVDPANPLSGDVKRPIRINDDLTYTRLQEQGGAKAQATPAPASAIEFLKKNPNQAENFKKKYGYLPEGF